PGRSQLSRQFPGLNRALCSKNWCNGTAGYLLIHRSLIQSSTSAFIAGLSQPCRFCVGYPLVHYSVQPGGHAITYLLTTTQLFMSPVKLSLHVSNLPAYICCHGHSSAVGINELACIELAMSKIRGDP